LSEPLRIHKPLRYVIRCAGCGEDVEIRPDELEDKLAICGHCNLPNATPVYALLSGRRKRD
jgi:rRNA maturation endonuclease Nob1